MWRFPQALSASALDGIAERLKPCPDESEAGEDKDKVPYALRRMRHPAVRLQRQFAKRR